MSHVLQWVARCREQDWEGRAWMLLIQGGDVHHDENRLGRCSAQLKGSPFEALSELFSAASKAEEYCHWVEIAAKQWLVKRMPTAEPQSISDHFQPALFFVVRAHYCRKDCKACAASHLHPPCQGSKGGLLLSLKGWVSGKAPPTSGTALRMPYFCPKI